MKKLRPLGYLAGLGVLMLIPHWVTNEYYVHQVVLIAIYAVLLFGLDIVVGYTGEVSLAHAALFGIGAYTAGILNTTWNWPFYAAIAASIPVTAFFGAVLALPALRVTGPYLAMVTLAFGTIAQILINEMDFLTNGPLGITIQSPVWMGQPLDEFHYYYVGVGVFVLALVAVHNLLKSHLGRAFEALRGSPVAADCMGVSVYHYKVYAFVISAGFAGLAGGLYSFNELYIAPNTYNFELTVLFLLALIMGGRKTRLGPVLGASIVVLLPNMLDDIHLFRMMSYVISTVVALYALSFVILKRRDFKPLIIPVIGAIAMLWSAHHLEDMTDWRITIFGFLILFVVYYLQEGLIGWMKQFVRVFLNRMHTSSGSNDLTDIPLDVWCAPTVTTTSPLLTVSRVLMQFGGLKALNELDMQVQPGSIHALIGPNGSGKSTLMNVLTGVYKPTSGVVTFEGTHISGKPASTIALRGLARTFQNLQLFGEMTVLENVLVGLNHTFKAWLPEVLLRTPRQRREEREARVMACALLHFVGLDDVLNEQARNLPYGRQRLLEIARALGLHPRLLLLDEPAAGLTAPEIEELVKIILKIRDSGVTVILIEHHMDLVMKISDTVTVLDQGHKISEGRPELVQSDPKVIAAYLGT